MNVGALLCCARSNITAEARRDRAGRTVPMRLVRGVHVQDCGAGTITTTEVAAMVTYYMYHRVRPENATLVAYRRIYRY